LVWESSWNYENVKITGMAELFLLMKSSHARMRVSNQFFLDISTGSLRGITKILHCVMRGDLPTLIRSVQKDEGIIALAIF
jgi:hypothetical protein